MYDKREPFQISETALTFSFNPSKFEIWSSGKKIDSGIINCEIQCIPTFFSKTVSEVKLLNIPEKLNIYNTLIFDLTFTSGDRIYLSTVPKTTNIENYDSFLVFRQNVPLGFPIITREERFFEENEPYVCSIFTINNKISKISFSFGNNPRLIEFYE